MSIVRTIEIPEELAARLEATPEAAADFNAFAVAALKDRLELTESALEAEPTEQLDEEMLDAIREYHEDRKAGRFYPIEHLDAQIETLLGRPLRAKG
ncbi:MAG TPA: hypothetical protein VM490_15685 [Armatimonadaceae bacterium]|nr:hypothetical protein [Armatimonadaceae bacterium]